MPMIFSSISRKRFSPGARWERFDARRTELIARNAKPPISVDSLDLRLEEIKLSRGGEDRPFLEAVLPRAGSIIALGVAN
jgi:hypothetical protein